MARLRLLLDECLPEDFRHLLRDLDVQTVRYAGLAGRSNGALLAAAAGRFDVLVTLDTGLPVQQALGAFGLAILVLRAKSNRLQDLEPLAEPLRRALASARPGYVSIVQRENE